MWRTVSHTPPLIGFLAGSVALHAAVFGLLAGYTWDTAAPPITLEVKLLPPEALPVAPPEIEPPQPVKRRQESRRQREPEHTTAQAPVDVQHERPSLALAAPQAPAESAFTVPAAGPSERSVFGHKVQAADAVVMPPSFGASYLGNPKPSYPLAARHDGVQGTVLVKVLVTREGLPGRVELMKGSGSSHLDGAALEAVKAWRFVPARRGAEPVEDILTVPIVFRLETAAR